MKTTQLGVGSVILDEKNESVLLILRKKNPECGKWAIPGGKLELHETLQNATIREAKEEIGVDIEITELCCTAETISPETEEHYVSLIYTAKIIAGEPSIQEPDSIADMKWFPLHQLPPVDEIACFSLPALTKLRPTTNIQSIISSLTLKEKEALKEAIAPIYFNDRSDYIRGLWDVVRAIIGDKVNVEELNEQEWLYALEPELYK